MSNPRDTRPTNAEQEYRWVTGKPAKGVRFKHFPNWCPDCKSGTCDLRWYSKDGEMLMAECSYCLCHFGVAGVRFDPDDPDEDPCSHWWVGTFEADGQTKSDDEQCLLCGIDRPEAE